MSTISLIISTIGKFNIRLWVCRTCGATNSDIAHTTCQFCGGCND